MVGDHWQSLGRVVLFSAVAYFALIALIRLLGTRTISKMNPGDFVVTVAIGSIAGSLIVQNDVPLSRGLVALATMLGLQFLTEWATSHITWLRKTLDGTPVLLLHRGILLERNMQRENIHEEDVLATLREHGIGRLADADAVVLEVDGTLSVIPTDRQLGDAGKDVRRAS
jgi:uncharacterized membrane protein YcaP (DUF421 family)